MYGPLFKIRAALTPNPFRDVVFDEALFQRRMSLPEPRIDYAIFFTPRSGSSRLTEILSLSKGLGRPSEFFNPGALPRYVKACKVRNLDEYVPVLRRIRSSPGVFGFEITYPHLVSIFGREERFHAAFPGMHHLWLIREDIVAQAVSVSRMVQTNLRHLKEPDPETVASADARFRYNSSDFKERIRRLVWTEERTEVYFARYGINPLRLSYEGLLEMSASTTVELIAGFVGADVEANIDPETPHARVSSAKSTEFARRFRAENARWLGRIEGRRVARLDALRRAGYRAGATD